VAATIDETLHERAQLVGWKMLRVDREHFEGVHVVDVHPHRVKGQVGGLEPVHNALDVAHVVVPPPALVEAKAPIRRHGRAPNDLMVLLNGSSRGRPNENKQVNDATCHADTHATQQPQETNEGLVVAAGGCEHTPHHTTTQAHTNLWEEK